MNLNTKALKQLERRNSTEPSLIGEIFEVEKSKVEISRVGKFGIDDDCTVAIQFGE